MYEVGVNPNEVLYLSKGQLFLYIISFTDMYKMDHSIIMLSTYLPQELNISSESLPGVILARLN
jgi:hypothetical protein